MEKLSELDLLIGGVGFVSGLLLASVFGGDKGGCGCGPKTGQVPQFINPPTDPLTAAKLVGPGVTQPAQTMGRAARLSGANTMGRIGEPRELCDIQVWTQYVNGVPTPVEVMVRPSGTVKVDWNHTGQFN
ncbi:MAG: hypothetical protein QM785_12370 [Pyrinomonadaceae bacterium]